MSLFDLSQELRNGIMNVGTALNNKASRDDVETLVMSHAFELDKLDTIFTCDDVPARRTIIDFIDDAIEELQERKKELDTMTLTSLVNGDSVKGFELVEGRMTRKVKDKEKAESALSKHIEPEAIYENKMIGIPAMEKALKAKGLSVKEVGIILNEFVSITHGKPVLVKTIEE